LSTLSAGYDVLGSRGDERTRSTRARRLPVAPSAAVCPAVFAFGRPQDA